MSSSNPVYQGVTATETIAAHKFTVSRYVGYGLPDRQVEVTLGQMLGADHVEWICAQPYPAGTAGCRARGLSPSPDESVTLPRPRPRPLPQTSSGDVCNV